MTSTDAADRHGSWIDLYWIPLGAGTRVVRLSGRIYERILARLQRRAPRDLYHSALVVADRGRRFTLEMAPVWSDPADDRGVVCEGPVGLPGLGRFRAFRYEVRCWRDGTIPDLAAAVGGPVRVTDDASGVTELLAAVQEVPPLTWGLDELGAGEMWNSNSLVAWLLARLQVDVAVLRPPADGRAPGWRAGLVLAARQRAEVVSSRP